MNVLNRKNVFYAAVAVRKITYRLRLCFGVTFFS